MSARTLKNLVIVLLVLSALAALTQWAGKRRPATGGVELGDQPLADLDLNAVQSVTIADQDTTNQLVRREHTWVVPGLYDYPLDFEQLRTALTELPQLRVGQVVRGGEELLDELGLTTNALTVALRGRDDEELARFEIGGTRQRQSRGGMGGFPDGRYLRVGDGPVILVDEQLTQWSATPADWMDKELLNVPAAEIDYVELQEDDAVLRVDYPETGAPTIDGLAPDESVDAANAGRLRRSLANLRAESVASPSITDEEAGFDDPVERSFYARDGMLYTVRVGDESEEGRYLRIAFDFEDPPAPTRAEAEASVPVEPETSEDTKDVSPPPPVHEELVEQKHEELLKNHQESIDRTKANLEKLRRLEDWTYVVPGYLADSLSLGRSDLVQEDEKAEPTGETTSPAATDTSDPIRPQAPEAGTSNNALVPPKESEGTAEPSEVAVSPAVEASPPPQEVVVPAEDEAPGEEDAPAETGPAIEEEGSLPQSLSNTVESVRTAVKDSAQSLQTLMDETTNATDEAVREAAVSAEKAAGEVIQAVEEAGSQILQSGNEVRQAVTESAQESSQAARQLATESARQVQRAAELARTAAAENQESIRRAVDDAKASAQAALEHVQAAAADAGKQAQDAASAAIEKSKQLAQEALTAGAAATGVAGSPEDTSEDEEEGETELEPPTPPPGPNQPDEKTPASESDAGPLSPSPDPSGMEPVDEVAEDVEQRPGEAGAASAAPVEEPSEPNRM